MPKQIKCPKCSIPMEEILTKKGILIDICSQCKGAWLDRGELIFFAKDRKPLRDYEKNGLEKIQKINDQCPRCASKMQSGHIPSYSFQVEECLSCRGIFIDAYELKKIQGLKNFQKLWKDASDILNKNKLKNIPSSISIKLPSLSFAMYGTCISLYGLFFAVFVFFMEFFNISLLTGSFVFLFSILIQFYFAPIILDWQLRLFGSVEWGRPDNRPSYFTESLSKLCKENNLPIPKVGVINDKTPQAYTYGRTPYSARLVFSKGIFELLDEDEVEAVLAHELGHIKHWDFVVMTVVQIVPLFLYYIYRITKESFLDEKSSSPKDKPHPVVAIAMVVSYLSYFISEYLVLFVSRIREYYADRFSCFATKKPNKLLTALVKIAYGLLSSHSSKDSKKNSYENKAKAFEALNIMNVSRSKQIALVHQGTQQKEELQSELIEKCMRWDLWNPWAFYYELNSTHPLTAKRINAISAYAISMKQKPYVFFKKEKPESYWDDFLVDIFFLSLPYILGFGSLIFRFISNSQHHNFIDKVIDPSVFKIPVTATITVAESFLLFIFCFSVGAIIRTIKSYPKRGGFSHYSVMSLLKFIKISPVRSHSVTLKGYILGRADAGNIFSEDLVLRDQTGMIFLNHEPFGLNILFALFRYKKFQGKEVQVTGWYRRSPTPYVEVKKITSSDTASRAYTYHYKIGFCIIGLLIPVIFWIFL